MMLRPAVRRTSSLQRAVGLTGFMVGVAAAGLLVLTVAYLLAGLLSWTSLALRLALVGIASGWVLLWSLGVTDRELPQRKGMIPIDVFKRPTFAAFVRFGLELGTGLRTYLPSPAPHLIAFAVLLGVTPLWALPCVALGWGVARSAPLVHRLLENARADGASCSVGTSRLGPAAVGAAITALATLGLVATGWP